MAALAVVVVAAGFLVWSVVDFVAAGSDVDRAKQDLAAATERLEDARDDDGVAIGSARDAALDAARRAVVVMNTVDYHSVDAGLDQWLDVTTGSLHDEVVSGRAESKKAIQNAKSVTKAKVLGAAVQEVDERADTATVLVSLHVDVSIGGAPPTSKFMRIRATMLRTEKGWKMDGIGQVPFGS